MGMDEFHGVAPDVRVEAIAEELQKGDNTCILRAEEYVLEESKPSLNPL